ncbi:sensor histidine kinase [Noviherbaspirillum galbum]|uniref:Signal transduction histidine kinase subgroup 3 dimerisation and phosphoacceptor domain-containing protein n=1 Tax=Noviherbaspirillum galbum TaxID=2709383 RepID=A0A6B3SUI7_9BURK|nr:histidine kinase [Noviherbaspirillum galbum]NEX64680.1 hypothetical protein [Noviherbaspirillum galbum]
MASSQKFSDLSIEEAASKVSHAVPMVDGIRLMLAAIALLAHLIDIPGTVRSSDAMWFLLAGYFVYAALPFAVRTQGRKFFRRKIALWCDVTWYAMLIAVTDPLTTVLFLFFPFAILVASFEHGCKEGRRITIGSVGLYLATGMLAGTTTPDFEWTWLFLRVVFLLSLGLMMAYWGGAEVVYKQRLALLREMNFISNPRFGVDQSIASIMEKCRGFFKANACVLLIHDTDSDIYCMRQTDATDMSRALHAQPLPADMAQPLLPFPADHLVLFGRTSGLTIFGRTRCRLYNERTQQWMTDANGHGERVADLLNTEAYIGAPVNWRRYDGRVYLTSSRDAYGPEDALFLMHTVEQAFRLIEHIDVLDRLASGAAQQERQRIVGDLHDSAIQPYIGLKMGLEALREQARPDNPLAPQIGKLIGMATHTLNEMRQYVTRLKDQHALSGSVLAADIRQLAIRFNEFYGICIEVHIDGELHLNDRLAAEVRQIVHEGLSNIRKHTTAQQGRIAVACASGVLQLEICNANDGSCTRPFMPRSIVTRVESLGGRVRIAHDAGCLTVVSISLPI